MRKIEQIIKLNFLNKYWIESSLFLSAILLHYSRLDNSIFESHSFRQTQTAFGIRSLLRNNFDLLNVELPVFGPPWKVPLEFPIYQFFAASLSKIFNLQIEFSGRLTSLIFFLLSAFLIYLILKILSNQSIARISLLLFLFTGYSLQWGTSLLIEWVPVSFSLLATLFLITQIKNNFSNYILFSILIFVSMSAASLTKVTSVVPYLALQSFFVLLLHLNLKKLNIKSLYLLFCSTLSLLPAFIWTRFADSIKEQNIFTVGVTSKGLRNWNFAYPGQRTDFPTYVTIFSRIDQAIIGLIIVFILGYVASFKFDRNYRIYLTVFLISASSAPVIFLNLYYRHDYYLVAIFPLIIAGLAISIWSLVATLTSRTKGSAMGIIALSVIYFTLTSSIGAQYLSNFKSNGGYPSSQATIQRYTSASDKLLVVNCDWDPTTLYFADRKGLMLLPGWYSVDSNINQAEQERYLDSNLPKDYWDQFTYLYVCGFETAQAEGLPSQVDQIQLISNKYEKTYLENGLYKLVRKSG